MDGGNEGGDGPLPNLDNLGGAGAPGEGDDINQYYDDAGETFLPADHVSNGFVNRVNSPSWVVCKTLSRSN